MLLNTTREAVSKAMQAYLSGKRSPGAREAKTWFIRGPSQQLLPLKHIFSLASGVATRDFQTSDAIATAQSLGHSPVFLGESLLTDLAQIQERNQTDSTTVEQLILARLGQGAFRKALVKARSCCFVTGYSDPKLLVASHIKPWAHSSDQERLDSMNGLLLIPTLDRAFDRGLITFKDDGTILISELLGQPQKLGIHGRLRLSEVAGREFYLKHHRQRVFKRGKA